ncbi:MAG: hypothetical protein H0X28_04020 [Solirubrobacterales bacterium]|nr:hypothetical protein [Solirubrobacterales bacterium]
MSGSAPSVGTEAGPWDGRLTERLAHDRRAVSRATFCASTVERRALGARS